jgi:hypothetical protein
MKGKIVFSQMNRRGKYSEVFLAIFGLQEGKRLKVHDQTAGTHYFLGYLFNNAY